MTEQPLNRVKIDAILSKSRREGTPKIVKSKLSYVRSIKSASEGIAKAVDVDRFTIRALEYMIISPSGS